MNSEEQCDISLSKAEHARITQYFSLIKQLFWIEEMIEILPVQTTIKYLTVP